MYIYNIYIIYICVERTSHFALAKDTPYLALMSVVGILEKIDLSEQDSTRSSLEFSRVFSGQCIKAFLWKLATSLPGSSTPEKDTSVTTHLCLQYYKYIPWKYTWFALCLGSVSTDFTHILQGYFTGTGAIGRFPQCQWSNPEGHG